MNQVELLTCVWHCWFYTCSNYFFQNLTGLWYCQFSAMEVFPMDLRGHMLMPSLLFPKLKHCVYLFVCFLVK